MFRKQKLIVSRYTHQSGKKRRKYDFTYKLIAITSVICIVLGVTSIIMASMLPKGAFKQVLSGKHISSKPVEGYVHPQPDDDTRIKADRLREIRYEDYLAHAYNPLVGEMDNVYIYDSIKKCYLTFDDGPSQYTPKLLDVLAKYNVKATFFNLKS